MHLILQSLLIIERAYIALGVTPILQTFKSLRGAGLLQIDALLIHWNKRILGQQRLSVDIDSGRVVVLLDRELD